MMKKFRKIIGLICMVVMLACLAACGSSNGNQETGGKTDTPDVSETAVPQQEETEENSDIGAAEQTGEQNTPTAEPAGPEENGEENSKVLVAYFSATGTTKKLAEYAADAMGADLYEIVPEEPYTDDDLNYSDRNTRATVEQNDKNVRPAISGSVENMDQYEIVFLAFPIWWGEEPRIMDTFVETYDFSGKTVIPFCTSGGSGFGSSGRNMQGLSTGDATWLDGARLNSSSSHEDMVDWINGLGLDVEAK